MSVDSRRRMTRLAYHALSAGSPRALVAKHRHTSHVVGVRLQTCSSASFAKIIFRIMIYILY